MTDDTYRDDGEKKEDKKDEEEECGIQDQFIIQVQGQGQARHIK